MSTSSESLKQQLETLGSLILDKPPYCSGTLGLPPQDFTLFYGKEEAARRVDLAHPSEEQLQHLAATCDAATFGLDQKDVLDETYRKAGKLDASDFATRLDINNMSLIEAVQADLMEGGPERPIRAELYKLNVYGPGSFFKSHVDTPRSGNMFGSLVLVFPTPHTGGALVLRHKGKEWTVGSPAELSDKPEASIAYVAFYSDVEHEVLHVKSGYRVTLTYNLYFKTEKPLLSASANIRPFSLIDSAFERELRALLDDQDFLPEGGILGFGLRHAYPVNVAEEYGFHGVERYLKGSDAVLLNICKKLLLDTSIQQVFPEASNCYENVMVLCDAVIDMSADSVEDDLWSWLRDNRGGKLLTDVKHSSLDSDCQQEKDIEVHWVTEAPEVNSVETPYAAYGNEATLDYAYAQLCLIVEVGAAGSR